MKPAFPSPSASFLGLSLSIMLGLWVPVDEELEPPIDDEVLLWLEPRPVPTVSREVDEDRPVPRVLEPYEL